MRIFYSVFFLFFVTHFWVKGQNTDLYINEISADNTDGFRDEFNEFPDWIELYNAGSTPLNLEGYSLTDDPSDSTKWVFPSVVLDAGQYMSIFASGKDIFNPPVVFSTVVDWGDEWKYLIPDASTSSNWKTKDFADSDWTTGPSGFGYGDDDDATVLPERTISVYLRTNFTVDQLQLIERGIFHMDFDDGFVAYLNGVEICRNNIGTPGSDVAFDEVALSSSHEAKLYGGGKPDMFMVDDIQDYLVQGINVLAVEVHNAGAGSSDLSAIPFLTLGYTSFDGEPYINPVLDLPGSSIHTNFKLAKGGEFIGLFGPDSIAIDTLTFGAQKTNISYGRSSINPSIWGFFLEPTPGAENGEVSFDFLKEPKFSIPGGFYTEPLSISLSVEGTAAPIYYTLDGTIPDINSILYAGPFSIDVTSVVRARSISDAQSPSEVITQTYFISEEINLPIISIVTDPDNLFSDERGIYVTGTNGRPGSCDPTVRNLNQDWERPVNLEFYDTSGEVILNQVAGIKIFGGCSRTRYPQKSFSLFARSEYGKGSFDAQLFPDKEIDTFESFILRSSADDQLHTMIKDAFAQYVQIEYMDIDYQAYRPTVVYINGAYWGIHNMREKINEHYLAENFDTDPSDVNILQGNGGPSIGSGAAYQEMINFASTNDLSDKNNYAYMQSKMDVQQYIDYQIANIYLAEVDWPGNNIKFWNSNSQPHNRWRWITFDRDQTFLSYRIQTDAMALATATNASGWPNPPWSTLLFRDLLTNENFRNMFIQIYAYQLKMTFEQNRILDILADFRAKIEDEIPKHIERWGGQVDPDMNESWTAGPTFNSVAEWEQNLSNIVAFTIQRPQYALQHLRNKFGLSETVQLTVDMNNEAAGMIKLFHKELSSMGYSAYHFKDVPMTFKAFSKKGYQFSHWSISTSTGEERNEDPILDIKITEATSLIAYFEPVSSEKNPHIVINEINYNSPDEANSGDWVELFNYSNEIIDLEGWQLKDEDDAHVFTFRSGTELYPGNYLVACENIADFSSIHPQVFNRVGDLGFKFSNSGEVIRLYNNDGNLIDSVRYQDSDPWPELADGGGPTLELINPDLNNDLAESWEAVDFGGSPGRSNSTITHLDDPLFTSNDQVELFNSFPNPTNGITTFSFQIMNPGNVSLKIFDILGNEVGSMDRYFNDSGKHAMTFDTQTISNGVYFYMLKVDNVFAKTKRMVVDH